MLPWTEWQVTQRSFRISPKRNAKIRTTSIIFVHYLTHVASQIWILPKLFNLVFNLRDHMTDYGLVSKLLLQPDCLKLDEGGARFTNDSRLVETNKCILLTLPLPSTHQIHLHTHSYPLRPDMAIDVART